MSEIKNTHIWLGLDLFLLSLLGVALYIFSNINPAQSYEVSVYAAFPTMFWVSVIIILTIILTQLIFSDKNRGVLLVLLAEVALIALLAPLARGYFIYGRGDVLTHIGRAKDILYTGHIGTHNFYPIMHILMTELNLVSLASLGRLTMVLPAFFWLMLLPWYWMFIRNLLNDRNVAMLSVLMWCLFPLGYWHTSMVGNMFSYVFMFLILGVWFSTIPRVKKYTIIFVLYLAMVYFHPLTSIYLLLVLTFSDVFKWIQGTVATKRNAEYFMPRMGVLVLGIWTLWYLSFPKIQESFRVFWLSIVSPSGNPFLNMYTANMHRYHLSLWVLMKFAVYRYFGVILVSILVILFLLASMKSENRISLNRGGMLFLLVLFVSFGAWSALNTLIHFVNFERSLRYVVAVGLPLAAYVLFNVLPTNVRCGNRSKIAVYIVIILLVSYFAVFTVQRSPLSGSLNMQVTASEFYGMGWWFTDRNSSVIGYDDGQITQYRFYQAWYGRSKVFSARNLLFYGRGHDLIPQDFGYKSYSYAGNMFSKPHYFILGKAMWEFYNATISGEVEYWRWKPLEYDRLKVDPTVSHVYSSTDIQIYYLGKNSLVNS